MGTIQRLAAHEAQHVLATHRQMLSCQWCAGLSANGLYFSVQDGFQLNKPHTIAQTHGFDLQHKQECFLCHSNDYEVQSNSFAVSEFLPQG
jgi:hypothetical protein